MVLQGEAARQAMARARMRARLASTVPFPPEYRIDATIPPREVETPGPPARRQNDTAPGRRA